MSQKEAEKGDDDDDVDEPSTLPSSSSEPPPRRVICPTCHRPKARACICSALPTTRLALHRCHVLVMQHPHEQRRKNRSLFLAELCFTKDSLTCIKGRRLPSASAGQDKNEYWNPILERLLAPDQTIWLIYPHPNAKSLGQAVSEYKQHLSSSSSSSSSSLNQDDQKLTLIFLDATWKFASEMERASQFPAHTQYIAIQSDKDDLQGIQPFRFDIRTPPSPEHLCTAECLALVASRVEDNPTIYDTILKPLDLMVAQWHSFSDAAKTIQQS